MKKILHIIAEAPLFNGLAEDQLNQVRQIAVDKFYDKGKTIFLDGDDCNGFYIVADGEVKIYKVSFEGKEHILHIYGPGNPFGEVPVFSGRKFPASAQTLLKSHLLFFPLVDKRRRLLHECFYWCKNGWICLFVSYHCRSEEASE